MAKEKTMMTKSKRYTMQAKVTKQRFFNTSRCRKVWHISRFHERYELDDDVRYYRMGPLVYTKDFVGSGTDSESCAYWRQLMALRSKSDWLILRGAFAELKNIAGNTSRVYRGYLLDSDFEPATDREIGRWLGVDEKKAKEILAELEDVGLLERVDCPKFEKGNVTKKKTKAKKKSLSKKGTKKPSGKKSSSRQSITCEENSECFRKIPEQSGKSRNALKKKIKVKIKKKAKVSNGNDNTSREIKSASANTRDNAHRSKTNKQPPTTPATTPPIVPTKAGAGGSKVIPFTTPQGRLRNNRKYSHGNCQRLGEIASGILPRYDQTANVWAIKVYQALKLREPVDSADAHREIGSFRGLIAKARLGLPPPTFESLMQRAVTEAERIVKYWGNRQGKPAAVWCSVFRKMVDSVKMAI